MENKFTLKGEIIERTMSFIQSNDFNLLKEIYKDMKRDQVIIDTLIKDINVVKNETDVGKAYDIQCVLLALFTPVYPDKEYDNGVMNVLKAHFDSILFTSRFGYNAALMALKDFAYNEYEKRVIYYDIQEITRVTLNLFRIEDRYYINMLKQIAAEKSIKDLDEADILSSLLTAIEPIYKQHGLRVEPLIELNKSLVQKYHRQASLPDDHCYLNEALDLDTVYNIDYLTKTKYIDIFFPDITEEEKAGNFTRIFDNDIIRYVAELVNFVKGETKQVGFVIFNNIDVHNPASDNCKEFSFAIYDKFKNLGFEEKMVDLILDNIKGTEIDKIFIHNSDDEISKILVDAGFEQIDDYFEYNIIDKVAAGIHNHMCGGIIK